MYRVYTAKFKIDGVKYVGAACMSSIADQYKNDKGGYEGHNFLMFDNGELKFPSWLCYNSSGILGGKNIHPTCYVTGDITKYDINNFNKNEMYFPTSDDDAVIVFEDARVHWYSILCFEFYLNMHIMLLVICLLPIECWS